jgi:hypothetical protein
VWLRSEKKKNEKEKEKEKEELSPGLGSFAHDTEGHQKKKEQAVEVRASIQKADIRQPTQIYECYYIPARIATFLQVCVCC